MKDERRYVVDTNLLVSASLGVGVPYVGVELIISSGHQLVFSEQTFGEFETVLMRSKFNHYLSMDQRAETLSAFRNLGLFVQPQRHFKHCRDPRDNPFLDVAVEGRVDALISGDQDLLVLENIEGIPIIRMADFLGEG